ncbi:5361_t:CDS:2 [Acaulospora morrowiae]|uniref:5361_t:CDS:1 n=1 Tax=Acaulospora morrowiae TaxID=94023 RepID=A0A9N9EKZ5_9GLOM|nr:5361_t:CDS:2 [Acaulospora morrowiae]
MLIPTSDITIASCDDLGGRSKKENRELKTDGLTDGRSDASGGGLGCHEDEGTITDDPPDEDKTEDEMKGGTVVINARKLWAPALAGRPIGAQKDGGKESTKKEHNEGYNRQRYIPTTSLLKQA